MVAMRGAHLLAAAAAAGQYLRPSPAALDGAPVAPGELFAGVPSPGVFLQKESGTLWTGQMFTVSPENEMEIEATPSEGRLAPIMFHAPRAEEVVAVGGDFGTPVTRWYAEFEVENTNKTDVWRVPTYLGVSVESLFERHHRGLFVGLGLRGLSTGSESLTRYWSSDASKTTTAGLVVEEGPDPAGSGDTLVKVYPVFNGNPTGCAFSVLRNRTFGEGTEAEPLKVAFLPYGSIRIRAVPGAPVPLRYHHQQWQLAGSLTGLYELYTVTNEQFEGKGFHLTIHPAGEESEYDLRDKGHRALPTGPQQYNLELHVVNPVTAKLTVDAATGAWKLTDIHKSHRFTRRLTDKRIEENVLRILAAAEKFSLTVVRDSGGRRLLTITGVVANVPRQVVFADYKGKIYRGPLTDVPLAMYKTPNPLVAAAAADGDTE